MANINDLIPVTEPLWIVAISDDPETKLKRVLESSSLRITSWAVILDVTIYLLDANGNKLNNERHPPYTVPLSAENNKSGPWINPQTGARVYPDNLGNVPDGTLLRYQVLISMAAIPTKITDEVVLFIQSADADGELNVNVPVQ